MELQETAMQPVDERNALGHASQKGVSARPVPVVGRQVEPNPPAVTMRRAILADAADALDKLDRIYDYVAANPVAGEDSTPALRLIVRSQAMWRATVANFVLGKAMLPHPSWNLPLEAFPPQSRPHFMPALY